MDGTIIDDNPSFNTIIKCECSGQNNTVCHTTKLYVLLSRRLSGA